MKKLILIICISIIALISCSRTVPCSNQDVKLAFIGFKMSEIDTIILRQYEKGSSFSNLLDTSIEAIDTNYVKSSFSSHDTTFIALNFADRKNYHELFPDRDWQIFIPALNMITSISDVVSPQSHIKCVLGGDLCGGCINPINSFTQNGQPVIPQYGSILGVGAGYLTYIHR